MLCLLECLFFQQLYLSLGWTLDYLYFTWLADWFTSGFKLFEISFDDVTVSFTSLDYFMVYNLIVIIWNILFCWSCVDQ